LILQQKIPLFNLLIPTTLSFLIIISLIFTLKSKVSFIFFLAASVSAVILFFLYSISKRVIFSKFHGELDQLEEKINILEKSIAGKNKITESLPEKQNRLSFLFDVSQVLIGLIDCEKIFDFLINSLDNLFPQADAILIFSFDKENDLLSLTRSVKKKECVIKEKNGEALDTWVLFHNQSLLIEDIINDFKFDSGIITAYQERKAHSFIVSPLAIEHKLIGIARIEAKKPASFSLDDSRILRNICDLAGVVLERAYLFRTAQDLAIKDSLTSLFVKDYFFEKLSKKFKHPGELGAKLGIVMLDIDDFKNINDSYGHVVGDVVLKKIASTLSHLVSGTGDIVARFGGEEFIILVEGRERSEILGLAEKIRCSIESQELYFRRKKIKFTVSGGVAFYPEDGKDALSLADSVDKLLYKAKNEGKNKICFTEY